MRSVSEPYRQRSIRPLGLRVLDGWRLKMYGIVYGGELYLPQFEDGLAVLGGVLPQPPVDRERAGVGFAILHQGRGVSFIVLSWWDRENELFTRVMVRGVDEDDLWVHGHDGEAGCVWDLQVIAFERDAYVRYVLAAEREPDLDAYLASTLEKDPD